MQQLRSVAIVSRVHGTWLELVIGSRGSATASMTSVEGVEVIQRGWP
jgi:hypothetical protein